MNDPSRVDRILDLIDNATQHSLGGALPLEDERLCWRCVERDAGDGPSGVCAPCREQLLDEAYAAPEDPEWNALSFARRGRVSSGPRRDVPPDERARPPVEFFLYPDDYPEAADEDAALRQRFDAARDWGERLARYYAEYGPPDSAESDRVTLRELGVARAYAEALAARDEDAARRREAALARYAEAIDFPAHAEMSPVSRVRWQEDARAYADEVLRSLGGEPAETPRATASRVEHLATLMERLRSEGICDPLQVMRALTMDPAERLHEGVLDREHSALPAPPWEPLGSVILEDGGSVRWEPIRYERDDDFRRAGVLDADDGPRPTLPDTVPYYEPRECTDPAD